MAKQFDAIIIGTGQAGSPLAGKLTEKGLSVAIIERKLFGGTCINTGCIPTKALIASAKAAQATKETAHFGIHIDGNVRIDFPAVKQRMRGIQNKYQTNIEPWLRSLPNCSVYKGSAHFIDDHTVQVNGEQLTGKQIFINVGGRAFAPPMPGIDNIPYLTNTTLLALDELPQHLIIIGGSYIGLEFAQMYRRFGCEVTIVEKADRLISREDLETSDTIKTFIEKEGIHVRLQAECISFKKRDKLIGAQLSCQDPNKEVIGSHVLLAIGRVPNTDDLNLDHAGVKVDAQGYIIVNDELQTNVPHIYALGDCNRKGAFTHTSYNDFEIVAANLLNGEKRRVSERIPTYALFTDPPLGRAGMTEEEARRAGRNISIAKRPMSKVKRAVIKDETTGFMKIVVDAETNEILGAAVLGAEGDEIIRSILDVMYAKKPYTLIEHAMHIHPTISELIPTMLEDDWQK